MLSTDMFIVLVQNSWYYVLGQYFWIWPHLNSLTIQYDEDMTVHHKQLQQASIPYETNKPFAFSLWCTKSCGLHAIATHIDLYNICHTTIALTADDFYPTSLAVYIELSVLSKRQRW